MIDLIRRQGKLGLILLSLLGIAACAPPQQEAQKRFFWPPGFSAPKIEYINFYHAEEDVRRDSDQWLNEAIFGKDRPTMVFERPSSIVSDGKGRVFVTDQSINKVFVWDFNLNQLRFLRNAKGLSYDFRFAAGLTVDPGGQIYVSDSLEKEILVFGADERLLKKIQVDEFQRPTGLAYDPGHNKLYVVDTGSHQVFRFSSEGSLENRIGKRGVEEGEFNFPLDVDVDDHGNLYVLDAMNARVQVFDMEGRFLRGFGERGTEMGSFRIPKSISVGPSGQVYVTDSQSHRFVVFSLAGEYLTTVGAASPVVKGRVKPGGFYLPEGIDVDENDAIWVVDSLNRMFHQFQYLNADYLQKHPIRPAEAYVPKQLGVEK